MGKQQQRGERKKEDTIVLNGCRQSSQNHAIGPAKPNCLNLFTKLTNRQVTNPLQQQFTKPILHRCFSKKLPVVNITVCPSSKYKKKRF